MKRTLLTLAVLLGLALPALAQQANIAGTIVDETAAALPGATVTLTGHGPQRLQVSGGDGSYKFTNLAPGTYKLSIQLAGFGANAQDVNVTGDVTVPPVTLAIVLRGEEVVVSASKVESALVNAAATMSVISPETIASSPAQNYGDLLRSVPGVNVIQMSARDINLTSRAATNTLSNSQLALLDGRSIYLDFFGMILWDFVPSNPADIKQIEVVRGPASAVWGANALTGVVNIITKSPREAPGGNVTLTGGTFSRSCSDFTCDTSDTGKSFGGGFSWAGAPNDRWSYRLSGGYFDSDPFARRTGTVPSGTNPNDPTIKTGGATYPTLKNEGTKQPKGDLRIDQELSNGGRISYGLGMAGTQGLIHTGIGPFRIESGSYMGYGRVAYTKGAFKLAAFANLVDTDAPNLLQTDAAGNPIVLTFKTKTYDLEVGHSQTVANRHILTYGGNARRNSFDISIAPSAEDRNEFGGYFQDEIFFDKFRLALGARVDKFGNLDKAVFSPRVAATFKPAPSHAFRISYNRAFRSPSAINNFLFITTKVADFPLAALNPAFGTRTFPILTQSLGNPDLKEEKVDAFEIGYTGTFNGKTTVSLAYYINNQDQNINFTTDPTEINRQLGTSAVYSAQNPPPGWVQTLAAVGIPEAVARGTLSVLASRGIVFPSLFTYLNLGPTRDQGFEASIDNAFNREWSAFANFSYQKRPEIRSSATPFPKAELGNPPKSRFNLGLNWNSKRWLGSAVVNYTDSAFWSDVLNEPYHGTTDSFTMVNATLGVKFGKDGKSSFSVKATNLLNKDIQQHIFADVVKRNLVGELRIGF